MIRQSIARVIDVHDLSDKYSWREDRRIAACYHLLVEFETRVAGDIVNVSQPRISTIPMKITEIATILDSATDIRIGVEHGNDDRVVGRCEINDSHNAVSAHHSHIASDTVVLTLVDSDEVIGATQFVADHLRGDELVLRQHLNLTAVHNG